MCSAKTESVCASAFLSSGTRMLSSVGGERISAKVGDHWIVIPSASGELTRVVTPVGLGYELNVALYVNRKRIGEIYLLTH